MEKYIKRSLENPILNTLEQGYVTAILGARQTGKTTLMNKLKEVLILAGLPSGHIFSFNFDDVVLRTRVQQDFYFILGSIEKSLGQSLKSFDRPLALLIDEAQKAPDVFELVKILHDNFRAKIKIILSGSASLDIQKKAAETLTGRVQHFHLYPLSLGEILQDELGVDLEKGLFQALLEDQTFGLNDLKSFQAKILTSWEKERELKELGQRILVDGGLPAVWQNPSLKESVYKSFTQTYLEKDIRSLKEIGSLEDFSQLLQVLSFEVGSLLNLSNLSQAVGISLNTLKKYHSLLLASFVLNKLPPFLKKARSGFVKSVKHYFFDVGIANYLAGRATYQNILDSKVQGGLWENVLIKSFESFALNQTRFIRLFFFRDYQGREVDLVVNFGQKVIPVEFTNSSYVSPQKISNLTHFFSLFKEANLGLVVYQGELKELTIGKQQVFLVPWWLWW